MGHHWFESLDEELLNRRGLQPPYIPEIGQTPEDSASINFKKIDDQHEADEMDIIPYTYTSINKNENDMFNEFAKPIINF